MDVMRAESLMALTNLTPDSDLDCLSPDPGILAVLTQMLLCAVRGQVSPPHPASMPTPIMGRGLQDRSSTQSFVLADSVA